MAYSYSIDDPAKNSKRTLAFILVVIIHVFFFWVLASGLGAKMVQTVMGPVETKMIEELPDDDKEPPPPPPDIEQPPPYVPPPEVSVDLAIDTGPTTAISNVTTERPVAAPPPPVAEAGRACGRQDAAVRHGQGRAHIAAGISAGLAPCWRGGHRAAALLRAGRRPLQRSLRREEQRLRQTR